MRSLSCTIALLLWAISSVAQVPLEKRTISAEKFEGELTIDGALDDAAWSAAQIATDFIENEPSPGTPSAYRSEVRFLYDDEAIYVGAKLFDHSPDSILHQLSQRDDLQNTDFFGIDLDCYRDGINGLEFLVTAAGVQMDTKYGQNTQDLAWNAVWWSAVQIVDDGWQVEMKIPYSALRFPEADVQSWHLNIFRVVRRDREKSFWSEVDPAVDGFFNQCGLLTDIRDIDPPTRLFFYPYVSAYMENDESRDGSWDEVFNGGMDVKYGINDAFTLDMTLIPDFGQVQSDNQVLNLSPFEVQFNENRQFFTEGTDLFNKVGIFYSRRIGGRPLGYFDLLDDLSENEEVVSHPSESRLLNATKVSGRNAKGLGIGLLNAITATTTATIRDTLTGRESEIVTDPLTNYNILVFDQNLYSNSYISLINTNVSRSGSTYDANVTGTEFRLSNKTNSAAISGAGALSQKYYSDSTALGFAYSLSLDKTGGNWNYGLEQYTESDTYDPNDLGILFSNNETAVNAYIGHRQLEPNKRFIRANRFFNIGYSRLYAPNEFQNFYLNVNYFFLAKDFTGLGGFASAEPIETRDYFEPRQTGRYYAFPINYDLGTFISSDYRRRFALDAEWNYRWFQDEGRQRFNFYIEPRCRVNDKFMLIFSYSKSNFNNDVGWVNELDDGGIIFGRRDQDIHETILRADYVFNNKMGLNFRLRHYWTNVDYVSYRSLAQDGRLLPSDYLGIEEDGASSHDTNFNAFNIDLVYKWVFSPGSEMSVVWKNSILGSENFPRREFVGNFQRTLEFDQVNSVSLKVLYFLDYRSLRGRKASS